jgi:hypothetical protein
MTTSAVEVKPSSDSWASVATICEVLRHCCRRAPVGEGSNGTAHDGMPPCSTHGRRRAVRQPCQRWCQVETAGWSRPSPPASRSR